MRILKWFNQLIYELGIVGGTTLLTTYLVLINKDKEGTPIWFLIFGLLFLGCIIYAKLKDKEIKT